MSCKFICRNFSKHISFGAYTLYTIEKLKLFYEKKLSGVSYLSSVKSITIILQNTIISHILGYRVVLSIQNYTYIPFIIRKSYLCIEKYK